MANLLTALRLLLIVPVTLGMALPGMYPGWIMPVMLLVAVVTDYFDGIVARRMGTASPAGQLFDHTTDFLFVTGGLAGAAWGGFVPVILPVLISIAFTQYVLDSHFLYKQKDLRMSFIGRWNGVFYFVPLIFLSGAHPAFPVSLTDTMNQMAGIVAILLILSTMISIIDRALAPLRRQG